MIQIPVIPNSPLTDAFEKSSLGNLQLRRNLLTNFIENAAFDPSIIKYDKNYHNSQGCSEVFRWHLDAMMSVLNKHFKLGAKLVEVGCGKGEFLEILNRSGRYHVTGYDSSYEGENSNIKARYLTDADRIEADGVILRHVLEHVQQPHLFLRTLHNIFGDVPIYVEVPRSEWILETKAFFDITYEHVNYFSEYSLSALFGHQCIAKDAVFGGQYQYIISSLGDLNDDFSKTYEDSNSWEALNFDQLFPTIEDSLTRIEGQLHEEGRIFVWGGATKGCLFLYHCMRLRRLEGRFSMVVDINPSKWGKWMPGSAVPIGNQFQLYQKLGKHDTIIIVNPNYQSEICAELSSHGFGNLNIVIL